MKDEDINFDVVKEYVLLPDEDGFTKESVDRVYIGRMYEPTRKGAGRSYEVIFVEGKCTTFGGYKSWITLEKYKTLLREHNLNKLV